MARRSEPSPWTGCCWMAPSPSKAGRRRILLVTRCAFPSPTLRRRPSTAGRCATPAKCARTVDVAPLAGKIQIEGPYGLNVTEVSCTAPASTVLAPGKEMTFAVLFRGRLDNEPVAKIDIAAEEQARRCLCRRVSSATCAWKPPSRNSTARSPSANCAWPRRSTPPAAA